MAHNGTSGRMLRLGLSSPGLAAPITRRIPLIQPPGMANAGQPQFRPRPQPDPFALYMAMLGLR